jgi:hypothetical protein
LFSTLGTPLFEKWRRICSGKRVRLRQNAKAHRWGDDAELVRSLTHLIVAAVKRIRFSKIRTEAYAWMRDPFGTWRRSRHQCSGWIARAYTKADRFGISFPLDANPAVLKF